MNEYVDPFILFAESRVEFLAPRQLAFCRHVLKSNDSAAAAKASGYPPDAVDATYDELRPLIMAWREQTNADYNLVLDVHRRAAMATHTVRVATLEGEELQEAPDYKVQNMGAKGLTDVLGFNSQSQYQNVNKVTVTWGGGDPADADALIAEFGDV